MSTDAQKAMLIAAAEISLASTELEAFKELMEDFRSRYGERSKLVHNIWGHSDDHPDKALWCRASDAGSMMAQLASMTAPGQIDAVDDLSIKCMAYSVKDLDDVAARLSEYVNRVLQFTGQLIENHPGLAAAAKASTSAPPIGEKPQLDLRQTDQTDPQSDQQDD